jgi:DNA-directed RNA polymerase subunit RPC12/RpoP
MATWLGVDAFNQKTAQKTGNPMKKGDITCPACGAGFRRIELSSERGTNGEYRCLACGQLLEIFDGSKLIAYRLTVQPPVRSSPV